MVQSRFKIYLEEAGVKIVTPGVSKFCFKLKMFDVVIIFLFIIITAITFVGIYRCHFLLKYTSMVVKQPGKNMHSNPHKSA